jgi:flagellar basal body-associated protein FliL
MAPRPAGSHALTGKRRHGLAWLPWLVLLLLVVIAVATYLVVHHADEEDNAIPARPASQTIAVAARLDSPRSDLPRLDHHEGTRT